MGEVVLEAGGIATATDRVRFSACPQNTELYENILYWFKQNRYYLIG
jgi:hypothetical protein